MQNYIDNKQKEEIESIINKNIIILEDKIATLISIKESLKNDIPLEKAIYILKIIKLLV